MISPLLTSQEFYYNTLLNLQSKTQPPLAIEYSFEKSNRKHTQ